MVYIEEHEDKHDALSREWHIKRMSRDEKMKLIMKMELPAHSRKTEETK